jgi:hypothetical protein
MFTEFSNIVFVGAILLSTACAQKVPQPRIPQPKVSELDKEAHKEPALPMHGGVASHGEDIILSSPSLTQYQKDNLLRLHRGMIAKTFKIQDEISMYKSLLFETITTRPYNEFKVDQIKKKLVSLNNENLQNMFSALVEARAIAKTAPEDEYIDLLEPFFKEERSHLNQ